MIDFVVILDSISKTKAKGYLWAIRFYYDYISIEEIRDLAGILREERIKRKLFSLKDFRSVDPVFIFTLAENGIRNIDQMLEAGAILNVRELLNRQISLNLRFSNLLNYLI